MKRGALLPSLDLTLPRSPTGAAGLSTTMSIDHISTTVKNTQMWTLKSNVTVPPEKTVSRIVLGSGCK